MTDPELLINAHNREPIARTAQRIGLGRSRAAWLAQKGRLHAVKDARDRWWSSAEAAAVFNGFLDFDEAVRCAARANKSLPLICTEAMG